MTTSSDRILRRGSLLAAAVFIAGNCAIAETHEPARQSGQQGGGSLTDSDFNEGPIEACIVSHAQAKLALQQQVLLSARAALRQCAAPGCPMAIRSECDEWFSQAELQVPTLVLSAKTELGDVDTARVFLDNEPIADTLTGQPVEAPPGPHVVTFVLPDGRRRETRIVVGLGEKNRVVRVEFSQERIATVAPAQGSTQRSAPHPQAPSTMSRSEGLAFGLVSLGSALLAGSFLYIGINQNSAATGSCAPNCSQSEVSRVRRWFILADVAGGVSAVTGGLGLYFYLSSAGQQTTTTVGYRGSF